MDSKFQKATKCYSISFSLSGVILLFKSKSNILPLGEITVFYAVSCSANDRKTIKEERNKYIL